MNHYQNLILMCIDRYILNFRNAKQEILQLSQMAEQINSKFSAHQRPTSLPNGNIPNAPGIRPHSNESVDLDNLFAFLSEVAPNNSNSNSIINEIGEKMDNLVDDLDVELESVIQQEIEGLTNERNKLNNNLKNVTNNNVINNNTTSNHQANIINNNTINNNNLTMNNTINMAKQNQGKMG